MITLKWNRATRTLRKSIYMQTKQYIVSFAYEISIFKNAICHPFDTRHLNNAIEFEIPNTRTKKIIKKKKLHGFEVLFLFKTRRTVPARVEFAYDMCFFVLSYIIKVNKRRQNFVRTWLLSLNNTNKAALLYRNNIAVFSRNLSDPSSSLRSLLFTDAHYTIFKRDNSLTYILWHKKWQCPFEKRLIFEKSTVNPLIRGLNKKNRCFYNNFSL